MPFRSPDRARAAIRQLTPVPAHDIAELGRGDDSVAYLVDGEWVFRFPAVTNAQATLRRELALLPALQGVLPLAIPAVEHVGRHDEQLVFAAYRTVPGAPLTAVFAKARFFTTVRWLQDVVFDVGRDGPHAAEPGIARLHDHLETAYRA